MDVRSTDELIAQGVSLFSAGDLGGAARTWLRGLEQTPGERRTVGYLKHLKKVAPEILELAERELSIRLEPHIKLSMPPIEVESGERELIIGGRRAKEPRSNLETPAQVKGSQLTEDALVTGRKDIRAQTPYAGRGHFPDVEPHSEPKPLSPPPPVSASERPKNDGDAQQNLLERIESLQQCLRADDLSGALALASDIERLSPNHPMVLAARQHCIPKLEAMWLSELGGESGFLEVGVASHELLKSNLDSMSGFLLSQIDGRTPVSQLLQLSGQPRFDTLQALHALKSKGLIQLLS